MIITEQEFTEEEVYSLFQEAVTDPRNNLLREAIVNPVIDVLSTPEGRNEYIKLGNQFLEVNAEMLAKEYPTKAVTFPRLYVDNVIKLFGFSLQSLKKTVVEVLKEVGMSDFKTINSTPTNVLHTVVLSYSDMILDRELRDSARHQTGLTIYNLMFNKYFGHVYNESVMAYTYMNLNGTWGLVKSENIINWIGSMVDTSYGFYKTKLTINMTPKTMVEYLNRLRSSFNQSMKTLCDRFRKDMAEGHMVGTDSDGNTEYVEINNFSTIRDNILRLIRNGDPTYTKQGDFYAGMARYKNVKCQDLYDLAQAFEYPDIGTLIDIILYVFIIKEGNTLNDINTTKYVGRISNFPTAVDRAIQGKPIIDPFSQKYDVDPSIMRAYICLVATYIMYKINDVKPE